MEINFDTDWRKALTEARFDAGILFVLAGNIFAIWLAVVQDWPLGEILWIFWFQSVFIGITNALRMTLLKQFSVENFKINDKPASETTVTKVCTVAFFIFHYGTFHVVYAAFLIDRFGKEMLHSGLFPVLAGFALAEIFFFLREQASLPPGYRPNLGSMLFVPYIRILPMHAIILFGGMLVGTGMILFMIMKTLADVGMSAVEAGVYEKGIDAKELDREA